MKFFRITALMVLLGITRAAWADSLVLAGGCFWCMEAAYQDVPGVTEVVSGFSGGSHPNPTYKGRHDGHYEAVVVTYDPERISLKTLLDLYWVNVDPFDDGGQFCDRGESYRPAIFVDGPRERELAEASLAEVEALFPNRDVVVPILPRQKFFPVEEYHQDYYKKNPLRYKYYRFGCGRDQRLDEIWEATDLRKRVADLMKKH